MSMTFIGPSGSCEFPWIQYALLRDTLLHHFGATEPAMAFSELERAGAALGSRSTTTSALRLRQEVERAQPLCRLASDKLAISDRTKDVLFLHYVPASPTRDETHLIGTELHLPWVGGEPRYLGDVFGNLVEALLDITRDAQDTDIVEVIDS